LRRGPSPWRAASATVRHQPEEEEKKEEAAANPANLLAKATVTATVQVQ
jgi:hypothetical protein